MLGVLLLGAAGCKDLDLGPSYQDTDLTFWQKPEAAEQSLNNAYAGMYSADYYFFNESLSDNAFSSSSVNGGQAQLIAAGSYDGRTNRVAGEWAFHYGGIRNVNNLLANIDKVPNLEAGLKARYLAEARFIRAYHYFHLTNWYGDVALIKNEISYDESFQIARSPKADVVAYMKTELDEIMPALPLKNEYAESDKGRITRGAAAALKAQILLYDSKWADAATLLEQIMAGTYGTYTLFPSFSGIFQPENENNSEVILNLEFVPVQRTHSMQRFFLPFTEGQLITGMAPSQSLVDNFIMTNGKAITETGSGYNETTPYANRDPRLEATIIHDGSSFITKKGETITISTAPGTGDNAVDKSDASKTGYYFRKYYDRTADGNNNSGLNLILIRYADVLLMYAEAKAMQNQLDEATWNKTIRAIRERAGFTDPAALNFANYAGVGNAGLIDIVRRERRSELALESQRVFDIRRWRIAETVMNGVLYGMKVGNSNIVADRRVFNAAKHYLWPVPQADIEMNKNLLPNNPNW
ncbi:RagB/SusD family nutrient uptake outer membrane protein [Chitinophaga sedimenti]|uniref:RagB/SusD family nutrient uptake outer membrane protein n=1 Tax=Chitinophaga sedimenti TaxID=2033606 RepID=UPI0020051035|nr:RagB/SusD family nutrient uptake outer membrane protein [Chitinophaga sedimenti]MCK7556802.1 RagB/SusD family nutrient uptake outer membrane protein [Chitinophaga sedimenti]